LLLAIRQGGPRGEVAALFATFASKISKLMTG